MGEINSLLARRFSRRHLISYAGRLSAVVAGGGFTALAVAPTALATYCGYEHSVNCDNLHNWNSDSCPPETCQNTTNYWTDCNTSLCPCPDNVQFYDCCGGCDSSGVCRSCNCTSGPPSCCFSGAGTWCGAGCGSSTVCCRKWICSHGVACC